jgi:hypothetical protein
MANAVGIVTGNGMDDRGIVIRFPGGITDSSLPHIEQIGSGGPPSQWVRGIISAGKLAGLEAEQLPLCSTEGNNMWLCVSFPHVPLWSAMGQLYLNINVLHTCLYLTSHFVVGPIYTQKFKFCPLCVVYFDCLL